MLLTLDSSYSWRRQRRAAQVALSKDAVRNFYPILTKEATLLVSALLTNSPSSDRIKHFQRAGASVIMSILYDYPTLMSEHDMTIDEIDNYNKRAAYAAKPGNFFVEFFPWMIYIPERLYKISHISLLTLTRQRKLDSQNGKERACSRQPNTTNYSSVF